MNRPFWSRRIEPDPCESIEPLLSLYADRMASPEEMRRIETHLPDCAHCREALAWMQATHRALAARPIALPPPDLQSRIAQAIAASSAAPASLTPGVLRPVRSFMLRPTYAAAASVTVLGIALSMGYSLWHTVSPAGIKPALRPAHIASALPSAKPHSTLIHPAHPRIASVTRKAENAGHPNTVPKTTAPVRAIPPREQVASTVLVPVMPSAPAHVETIRHPAALTHDKTASVIAPLEKRQPLAARAIPTPKPVITLKAPEAPLVAARQKEPVPVTIRPFTVTPEAPAVQTASVASRPKPDDSMGKLAEFAQKLRNAPYAPSRFTVRQASTGAASAVQALESEPVAYYGAIHSDTTIK